MDFQRNRLLKNTTMCDGDNRNTQTKTIDHFML